MYRYDKAIDIIISRFHKLALVYKENSDYYEELPYVFYESEFTNYIVSKIQENNELELKNIFDLIEDMLSNGDEGIVNLIEVSIIESLYYEENYVDLKKMIYPLLGTVAKDKFDKLPKK